MADEEGANSNRRQSTLTPPTILAFLREFTSYMMIKVMATNESPETLDDARDEESQRYPSNSPPDASALEGDEESESTRRGLSRDISTSNHAHAPLGDLGSKSKTVSCPFCHQTEATKTRHKLGRSSVIWAIALLLVFWPLFWVPLVLPCCKLTTHFCPNCFEQIGASDPFCCD